MYIIIIISKMCTYHYDSFYYRDLPTSDEIVI